MSNKKRDFRIGFIVGLVITGTIAAVLLAILCR